MRVSTCAGTTALKNKEAEALWDAGFGDTHNDLRLLRPACCLVRGPCCFCRARTQVRITPATAMRTGSPLSITSSRIRTERSRSKTSNSSAIFFLSAKP